MLCHESSEATRPRTWPVGHQFRLKKMRIESATAIRIPSSTPKSTRRAWRSSPGRTPICATRKNLATIAKSISESAAAITIAASAELRQVRQQTGQEEQHDATSAAPTSPVTWLLAPLCSATAVREPLVETGNPWKSPAKALAAPIPIISWLASTSSPRRAAKLVDVAIVSASDTNVIPRAAASSTPMSVRFTDGNLGSRKPLRQRTDGRDARGSSGRTPTPPASRGRR